MFHRIPTPIARRMRKLERLDARQRKAGLSTPQRLRQIPAATGQFIALLAAAAPRGVRLEIGTSGGYSALWLALGCRQARQRLVTFEIVPEKAALARETFRLAGLGKGVKLIVGDGRDHLVNYRRVGFCFLDAEKEHYLSCYRQLVPRLVKGGILAADNVISHRDVLQPMIALAHADPRVDAVIVPIGSGVLVCRKI